MPILIYWRVPVESESLFDLLEDEDLPSQWRVNPKNRRRSRKRFNLWSKPACSHVEDECGSPFGLFYSDYNFPPTPRPYPLQTEVERYTEIRLFVERDSRQRWLFHMATVNRVIVSVEGFRHREPCRHCAAYYWPLYVRQQERNTLLLQGPSATPEQLGGGRC